MIYGRKVIGTVGYLAGVPMVHTEFVNALSKMVAYNERYTQLPTEEIKYVSSTVSYHVAARNEIIDKSEGDWIFQIDCDLTFEPDDLNRLLRTMNEGDFDVVCGVYYTKGHPHLPVLYRWSEEKDGFDRIADFEDGKVLKVAGAGGGCLLVKRSVFERIENELGESPFEIRVPYSEDLSFFHKCRELGIEVWCDTRVKFRHLRTVETTAEDHQSGIEGLEMDSLEAVAME